MFDIEIGEVYFVNQGVPVPRGDTEKTSDKFMTSEDVPLLMSSHISWLCNAMEEKWPRKKESLK